MPELSDASFASPDDERWMRLALDQALNARLTGEVPVGAVLVRRHADGSAQLIATGYNRPITTHDPTAHAEIIALRHAASLLENYRLPDCELYVTLEPCAMCATAMMHARLRRVIFAATDPKTGVGGSVLDLFGLRALNHQTRLNGGVMAEPAAQMLREFFAERRAQQRELRQLRQLRQQGASDAVQAIPATPGIEVDTLGAGGHDFYGVDI